MKIAVEGCAHGELDKIYEALQHLESVKKIKIDLLIVCGDFQSVRNKKDMSCMAVPDKYKQLNTFYKYHSGEKVAPILTIFIGGNHEASNYLCELFYGGWVCPNIYYMGRAGVVQVNGIRIAGLSGIYKGHDYLRGHFEHVPFTEETKRSVYHVRNLEVFRLKQLKQPLDIFISHDWPKGVYNFGNVNRLLKRKQFLRDEVEKGTLGSRPAEELLSVLQPSYWFAAHLHCKFAALVPHYDAKDSGEQIRMTRFLALDKCLPRREFLQILDVGPPLSEDSPPVLQHDPEWLAVLSLTNHLMNLTRQTQYMPGPGSPDRYEFTPSEEERKEVCARLDSLTISPELFEKTAGSHDTQGEGPFPSVNPQTLRLCKALNLTDPAVALLSAGHVSPAQTPSQTKEVSDNPISSEEDEDCIDHVNDDTDPESTSTPTRPEISGVKGLFIIDKRRSREFAETDTPKDTRRSKLILSAPVNFPDLSSDQRVSGSPVHLSTPNKSFLDQDSFLSTDELESDLDKGVKRLSDADDVSSSVSPVKRTMKRRNLNLYRGTDEDNDV